MELSHGLHLAYCTNIHRGESWAETFDALQRNTLAVRDRVAQGRPYAIGLRLGAQAARELSTCLVDFQRWLDRQNCYVFTINGFPFGQFHGTRVKEQVYAPDWTSPDRVEYTNLLFNLLADLLPAGIEGSVSTVPCSFKEFITHPEQVAQMRANLWNSIEHVAGLSDRCGKRLCLALEPEPLCYLETSQETVCFFDELRDEHPEDGRLERHLSVNYDTCHLAVEFEDPAAALRQFLDHRVRIGKLHFSSALKVNADAAARQALAPFVDQVYFHQVVERNANGNMRRYRDLDDALSAPDVAGVPPEWRIHFHIPLHLQPAAPFASTTDHLTGVMDALQQNPELCSHVEMETYTWEVLPESMKVRSVVDQLVGEYGWTLAQLAKRGFVPR